MAMTSYTSVLMLLGHICVTTAILTTNWKHKYDYVIVGGGTAGCVLANRLSEDPKRSVLLLEAGEEPKDPFISVPPSFLNILSNPDTDWGFQTEDQPHTGSNQKIRWAQAKMLGGCSEHNAMYATRGSPADYNRWHELGNNGWSYEDVLPYFKKLEDNADQELAINGFHGVGGPVPIQITPKDPLVNEVLKSAVELGYEELPDYNGPQQEGFGWAQINVNAKGQRMGTFDAYLKPILARRNLDVVTNALVTKVDIKGKKKAKGVVFEHGGNSHFIDAQKEVIVSAGAINSPKLLMLSGIGPKQHLKQMGIKVLADLPVGENLQDHSVLFQSIPIMESSPIPRTKLFTFEALFEYIFTGKGIWSTAQSRAFSFHKSATQSEDDDFPYIEHAINPPMMSPFQPELRESIRNGSGIIDEMVSALQDRDEGPRSLGIAVVNLHGRTRGTVKLSSNNPNDKPIIDFPYLENMQDVQDLIEGIRRIQSLVGTSTFQAAGAQPISCANPVCVNEPFDSDAYWECCVRYNVRSLSHYVGTCRMASDNTAVVDDNLRVKGIQRLRVIDSSIMPLSPSGHTNIPTIMIAEKGADLIKNN